MKELRYILFLVVFIHVQVFAQQNPISNFYEFNEYLLNPAEAGFKNKLQGSLSHRLQWQGLEGAPKTTFFGMHGAINEKMGIGGRVTVDKTDILQQFSGALSYAYRIKLNENSKLNFGLSAQFLQNNIRISDAIFKDEGDDLLTGGDQEGVTFDAEAGVMLEWGKAKIGISSSHLFESGVDYELENRTGTFNRVRLFNSYVSYLFEVSDDWNVEPFVLLRNQGKGSLQYEVNTMLSWQQTLFLGAGYRKDAGFIARLGFQFNDRIMAAYAYEFSSSGIASYSSGSHEFMLGYQLFKSKAEKPVLPATELLQPTEKEDKVKEQPKIQEEITEQETRKEEVIVTEQKEEMPDEIAVTPKQEEKVLEIKEQVPEKKGKIKEELFEQKIPFEFERMNFTEDEKSTLNELARELVDFPNQKILIEGHTCNMGTDAVNRTISLERAKSVKDYFISKGVKKEQIQIKGKLDTEALVPNNSLENRKKNRRVEFELIR